MNTVEFGFCSSPTRNRAHVEVRLEQVVRGAKVTLSKKPTDQDKKSLRETLARVYGRDAALVL